MSLKPRGLFVICLTLFALPNIALAYIGPGAGITFVGALVGVVLAVLSAISFILFWPIRKILKRMKARGNAAELSEAKDAPTAEEDAAGRGTPADK